MMAGPEMRRMYESGKAVLAAVTRTSQISVVYQNKSLLLSHVTVNLGRQLSRELSSKQLLRD